MDHEETTKALKEGRTSLGIEFGSTRIKAILIDERFSQLLKVHLNGKVLSRKEFGRTT